MNTYSISANPVSHPDNFLGHTRPVEAVTFSAPASLNRLPWQDESITGHKIRLERARGTLPRPLKEALFALPLPCRLDCSMINALIVSAIY